MGSKSKENTFFGKVVREFCKNWMSIIGIILLAIVFSVLSYLKNGQQFFMTWDNWRMILIQSSTVTIVAIGQSLILIGGNFDLSLGRIVCLTGCVGAVLMKNVGLPVGVSIAIMFAVGLAVGVINGFLTAYVGIPAFISTLGTQYICYGIAKYITNATPIPRMPEEIAWLGRGSLFGGFLPSCVLIMLVLYIIVQFMTSKTRIGRNLYAVGGSKEAAFFSGINVKKYHFFTFVVAALLATFGSLILMSRLNSVAVTNGQNYEFDAVIGSIIGGVSLSGGKGCVIGTMFGCLFLNILFNGFSQMGIDPFIQDILKGLVLVIAVTLDIVSNKKKS